MAAEACKKDRTGLKGSITSLGKSVGKLRVDTISQKLCTTYSDKTAQLKTSVEENYFNFIAATDEAEHPEIVKQFEDMIDKLDDAEKFFQECQQHIDGAAKKEEEKIRKEKFEHEEKIRKEKMELEERLEKERIAKGIPSQKPQPQAQAQPQKPKLPQLSLPTFDGKFSEWLQFRDRFNQAVHNRKDLSGAEKLNYLLSALQGSAAEAIKSIPISDDGYLNAYNRITKLYKNDKEIVYNLIDTILDQPEIKVRSAENVLRVANTTANAIASINVIIADDEEMVDAIWSRVVTRKLDPTTLERLTQHLQSKSGTNVPKFSDVQDFLDKEMQTLHASSSDVPSTANDPARGQQPQSRTSNSSHKREGFKNCVMCTQPHLHFKCPKLTEAPEKDRRAIVEKAKLCTSCLSPKHTWKDCPSTLSCRSCGKKHHSLLHSGFSRAGSDQKQATLTTHSTSIGNSNSKLKPTAVVGVSNIAGQVIKCRALIDNCSDATFIKESLVKSLGLKSQKLPQKQIIEALQGKPVTTVTEYVDIDISSLYHTQCQYNVRALIITNIGGNYPPQEINVSNWSHLPTAGLADPEFFKPKRVELLLSTDIHYEIIRSHILRGKQGEPVAQESTLGWLVAGGSSSNNNNPRCNLTDSLDSTLQKFWEVEHGPAEEPKLTIEEKLCETHFSATTTRLHNGTYEVQLPFKEPSPLLGNSKSLALKRFFGLEAKFKRNPSLKVQYVKSMEDLIRDGHMEKVSRHNINLPDQDTYYLPHHAVVKESSSTTKLRVVFDASAKSTTGVSLNDKLMVGPVIQQDLTSLLVRWRSWQVSLSADIKQMYLYISMAETHRNFQRIFWRSDEKDYLTCYQLKKVTFGTASAPFQAVRTLQQLAIDNKEKYPEAAEILRRDFYIDDCLTGANSTAEAKQLADQLMALCKKGNFILRKWQSSDAAVLKTIPPEMREDPTPMEIDRDDSSKALGLVWNPKADKFQFKLQIPTKPANTKRTILSEIAKIFDPLGFLAPVTIRAKMLMQDLWKCQTGWDSKVPDAILKNWESYLNDIKAIEEFRIQRCISIPNPDSFELHGFCDASEKAYAAVVYMKTVAKGKADTRMIMAKTRVAPSKEQSLPKLELCGAVLLAQLMVSIKNSLGHLELPCYAWTDSTITLAWIKGDPQRWKTFIRNRVITIQEHIPSSQWSHVPGVDNPADLPSRGISTSEFTASEFWLKGPDFLKSQKTYLSAIQNQPDLKPEMKEWLVRETRPVHPTTFLTMEKDNSLPDIDAVLHMYSNWTRLKRLVAWLLRPSKVHRKLIPPGEKELTASELAQAEKAIIHYLQQEAFAKEIQSLREHRPISRKSKILSLTPFLQDSLLRVGGRIRHAEVEYDRRHPLLLPHHHVTDLIIHDAHWRTHHGGTSLVLNTLQENYWIVRGRTQVRKIIRRCKICTILRAKSAQQLMANLPEPRVRISAPFTHTGIDYAGPIQIKESTRRKAGTSKAYIAVFVCLCTKAVTLELVSELTTAAFLAALTRFTARRKKPTTIKSDNGTTFVGANNELKEMFELLQQQEFEKEVVRFLANSGIKWTFIPPSAPHMGGIWEAAVKSTKYHLKRVIGKSTLTYEQYDTLLKEVEACLNSRPLCPNSSDPQDFTALTPGHFLNGENPMALPNPDLTHLPVNRLDRWQHQKQMAQHFWIRWQAEYLQQLQRRTKWKEAEKNLKVGELVVIVDEQHPPQFWKLGRIEEVHPNSKEEDKLIRTVTVRTATGLYKRPITKLVVLPHGHEHDTNSA